MADRLPPPRRGGLPQRATTPLTRRGVGRRRPVESFNHIPGVQANFTVDEFLECDELVPQHPDFIAALRSAASPTWIWCSWTPGPTATPSAPPEYRDRRIGWSDTWRKEGPGQSPYAHPISGLHCIIDVNSMEVLRVEDNGGVDEPNVMGEYAPKHIPERIRSASRREPLKAAAPHAARRGVVHSTATCCNGRTGRCGSASIIARKDAAHDPLPRRRPRRSVAHRISLAEMIVPYRDSSEDHYRRTAFDIGEWALLHDDVAGAGLRLPRRDGYLDAVLHNSRGRALHDHQRHLHPRGRQRRAVEARRPRRRRRGAPHAQADRLVPRHRRQLREYLVYWRFYQDGNIECEIRHRHHGDHTGGGGPAASERNAGRAHVCAVPPTLSGRPAGSGHRRPRQHGLHVGVLRRADGPGKSVRAVRGAAQCTTWTESEGKQDVNFATQRSWKVVNTNVVNGLGTHLSYKLAPNGAIPMMFDKEFRSSSERPSSGTPCGSRRTTPTNVGPQASSSTSRQRTPGSPSGPRLIATSRTPMSCSGTCSVSTTSPGRRTGR